MQKVIIIGAPRSGTNMLRDVLCTLPGVGTWPCDEINYIWRYSHADYPTDEFLPEMATVKVKKYIENQFDKISKKYKLHTVVEKTCANSIRIGFIRKIFPDARFIFIYRNGIDASVSAQKRWRAKLDIPYLLKKARYVPPMDLPKYALKYIKNRLHLIFSSEKQLGTWGPKIENLHELARDLELIEVCGVQWDACVLKSLQGLESIPESQVCKFSYESFVSEPEKKFAEVCDFLQIKIQEDIIQAAVSQVSAKSVGKGEAELGSREKSMLIARVEKGLKLLGYDAG